MKKTLSLILALVMVCALLPAVLADGVNLNDAAPPDTTAPTPAPTAPDRPHNEFVAPTHTAAPSPAPTPAPEPEPEPEPEPVPEFTDVPGWCAAEAAWCAAEGIAKGTTADGTTFDADRACSSIEILLFLYRANGSPAPSGNARAAGTLSEEEAAVAWAEENGLVEAASFDPDAGCTRGTVAVYLWKLAGSPETDQESAFTDVDAGEEYAKAVAWCEAEGITNGTGDGSTFSPERVCTRGEIVTFLYRAYGDKTEADKT